METLQALKKYFGYDQFLSLQEEIIQHVLSKQDSLVLMPTGGGKSLCYQLPALLFDDLTIVISPLISLMKDQVDALKENGIPAEFINSTLSYHEIDHIQDLTRQGEIKILYLAPERLAIPAFRHFLSELKINLIAIDEAHCISEWGHDFRPDYRNLKTLADDYPDTPIIALTATATRDVQEDIAIQLNLRDSKTFTASFNRPNLSYIIHPKTGQFADFQALIALLEKYKDESTIIYCFSRKDTESIADQLRDNGFQALPYHAGLDDGTRKATQESFIRDKVSIITATIAFGMGIDKSNVRLIVHYSLPKSLENYYQETGRAGRDGLPSECVLFYSYGDKMKQDFFIDQKEDPDDKKKARRKLSEILRLCEITSCRRRFILNYFGEDWDKEDCGGCDVCLAKSMPVETFDATEITQKVLSAVIRTGEGFGAQHICDVLRGSKNQKVKDWKHDALSVYGIVKDFAVDELKQIIRQLIAEDLLIRTEAERPTLRMGDKGFKFLKQRETINLPILKQPARLRENRDTAYDQVLFDRLRVCRKKIAESKDLPPFVIFHDTALRDMAVFKPQSLESFAQIKGVGESKLNEFAEPFITVIKNYVADKLRFQVNRSGSTLQETKHLLEQKLSLEDMAQSRGVTIATIVNHIEKLQLAGEPIDIEYLAPNDEGFIKIKKAFDELGCEKLKPVYERLNEEFPYEQIRLARLFHTTK